MEEITFWHTVSALSPTEFGEFISKDLHTKRKSGMGGQGGGLYVWGTNKSAKEYVDFLENELFDEVPADKNRYIVGLSVSKDSVYYPQWQLDTEAFSPILFPLIAKEAELLSEIDADVPFIRNETGAKCMVMSVNVSSSDKGGSPVLLVNQTDERQQSSFKKYRSFSAENSGLVQALSDYLYEYSDTYKEAYDSLIEQVVQGKQIEYQDAQTAQDFVVERVALKYCGTQKLAVTSVEKCKNGKFENVPLDTVLSDEKNNMLLTKGMLKTR